MPTSPGTSGYRNRRALLLCTLWAATASVPAPAETSAAGVQRCALISSDAERLRCYDDLARVLAQQTEGEGNDSQPPPPPVQPAPIVDPVDEFGRTAAMDDQPALPSNALQSLTATITRVTRRQRGERVFALDNGQVWAETESKPSGLLRTGDTIEIRRGRFGGFRLYGQGKRGYRVERLR